MPDNISKTPLYLKLVTAVVSVILFILVAEIALRIVDPELGYKNQFFPVNRDIDFPEFYEKDARLFWKLRAGQTIESRWFSDISYEINSLGLRGPEIQKNKPDVRILALGNSCTFGWGVPYEKSWTHLLEQKLNVQLNKNVEIVNGGIPGYSSHQGKILFEQLINLKPDLVLIMFGWNDHWRAGKDISDAEQNTPPEIVIGLQNIFSKLKLYKLIRKATLKVTEDTTHVRIDDITGKQRVSTDEFFGNIKEIISTAQKNNIVPILLIPPIASLENYQLGQSSPLHTLHHRYQQQIIKVSQYLNVPLVNLQTEFDLHNNLFDNPFDDPIHFNIAGCQIVSESILPVVKSALSDSKKSPDK